MLCLDLSEFEHSLQSRTKDEPKLFDARIYSPNTHTQIRRKYTFFFLFFIFFFSRSLMNPCSRTGLLLVPVLVCVEGVLVCVCASACGVRSRTVNEKECLLLLLHNIKCSANSTYQSCEKHSPQGF